MIPTLLNPALAGVLMMMRTRAEQTRLPEDLAHVAEQAGLGDDGADQVLKLLLRATAAGNKGVASGRAWPADEDVLIAMSIRDGLRAAAAGVAEDEPVSVLKQTVIVNGQSVQVPRGPYDHVPGVAVRAVEMARFDTSRDWEVKDEAGEVLRSKANPDRIRFVSLRVGTAS